MGLGIEIGVAEGTKGKLKCHSKASSSAPLFRKVEMVKVGGGGGPIKRHIGVLHETQFVRSEQALAVASLVP